MISSALKQTTVSDYGSSEADTGSTDVQVALLTESIRSLTEHLKIHKKDNATRRGLLGQVAQRSKLLRYLRKTDAHRHHEIVVKLGIRH